MGAQISDQMPDSHQITLDGCHKFLISCAKSMELCATSTHESAMVRQFSAQLQLTKPKAFNPNPMPCLRNLDLVKDMKLAKDFQQFACNLPWTFSPRTVDQGRDVAIMNFNNLFDMGKVATGLMYIDVEQSYPEHNHPGDEMYFLISGTAKWRWGGNGTYQKITAGNVIYNHPYNWHGVEAGPTPVLALYLQIN